jgi:TRAP-type uncharacterized transport system substrate-binding protein
MGSIKEDFRETIDASLELLRDQGTATTRFFREAWPLVLLLVIALTLVIWFAKPAPPRRVIIATGSTGASVHTFAKHYADFFRRHGITLQLVSTGGSGDNIALLIDPRKPVHAAFVQGGIIQPEQTKGLLSLGSIAYEPLWFFYRGTLDRGAKSLKPLKKQKVSIGPPESGSNTLARQIMMLNGLSPGPNILEMPFLAAAEALQRGEIKGMMIVDSVDGPLVQDLLRTPGITLGHYVRAAAYTKRLHFLEAIELPTGSIDLSRNIPPNNVTLVATTVSLIVREDLHPAIQMLFMQAAAEVNGRESFFAHDKEFPSCKDPTVRESEIARRFHKNGPPFLMRYLPFWLAEFVDRMFVIFMPLIAFAYPVISAMPNFRRQRALKRLRQHYGKLKFLENEMLNHYDPGKQDEYLERLGSLEKSAMALRVPKSLFENYYELRSNINFVREWLNRLAAPGSANQSS